MHTLRQAASGLLYALLSILLVVGSLSIALSERNVIAPPLATSTPTRSESQAATSTPTPTPTVTQPIDTSSAPMLTLPVVITSPTASVTPYIFYAQPPTRTAISCGPFYGWVRAYTVQPGDSLFGIATQFGTTVSALERANCRTSSLIYAGERLWVPYAAPVAPVTPGVTIIPTFETATAIPTEPLTLTPVTPVYYTPTDWPTDTVTPDP